MREPEGLRDREAVGVRDELAVFVCVAEADVDSDNEGEIETEVLGESVAVPLELLVDVRENDSLLLDDLDTDCVNVREILCVSV